MVKLTGSVSRKVPIPGTEFSSQCFLAGMEIEVGNDASSEDVHKKFQEMYGILEKAVKEQIVSNGVSHGVLPEKKEEKNDSSSENASITANQKRLLEKLVTEQKIFGKERFRLLGIKTKEEASATIKNLLSNNHKGGDQNEK
ncbi:MAG: hypothetical protein V2A65_08050 [Candidatus Omnitrophota bacterium]